jgi:hypothetical protein
MAELGILLTLHQQLPLLASHALVMVVAALVFRTVLSLLEWIRVHYLVITRLPRGPPVQNIFLGNLLETTKKDFHRVHTEYADKYGGILSYRVLWIHVRTSCQY